MSRELLRQYLQTGDSSVLPLLIATANRGGIETVNGLVHQLCAIDLQNVEETLLRLFGPGDIRRNSTQAWKRSFLPSTLALQTTNYHKIQMPSPGSKMVIIEWLQPIDVEMRPLVQL